MTDRLADLHGGRRVSRDSDHDLEAGIDDESNRLLEKFNREVEAIDKVIVWANDKINGRAPDETTRTQQLEAVEQKVKAVRRRLKAMADSNKKFASENSNRPATVRTRIVRYTKCSNDFIAMTESLSSAWDAHRQALAVGIKRDIMTANPHASESQVEDAINSGEQYQLDAVLSDSRTSAARHQVEDIRERNKDIQKLVKSVAELNQIFQDMSILVETQQELINNIEYTVQEVKSDVKQANEELVQARAHQKSKKKKKICICIIVLVIIAVIVVAITIPVLRAVRDAAQTANAVSNVANNNNKNSVRTVLVRNANLDGAGRFVK